MKNFKAIIFALTALIIVSPSLAQRGQGQGQNREMMQELHGNLKSYHDENIYPEMLKWKQQLDNSMETDDLQKLNELRAKASELKDKMHTKRREMIKNRRSGGGQGRGEGRKGRGNEFRGDMMEIHNELLPLAEKYKSTLEEIAKQVQPKAEQWKEDSKDILDEWKEKYESEINEFKDRRGNRDRGMRGMTKFGRAGMPKGPDFNMDNRRSIARFMLWDGEQRSPVMEDMRIDDELTITNLSNSPNPFSDATTISFELPEKTNVKLSVLDSNGNEIETLLNKTLTAGEHSAIFNAGGKNLPNGTYYYKLQTSNYTETGKMIMSK